jgi:hypothetical protein
LSAIASARLGQRRGFNEFPGLMQVLHFLVQCGHLSLLRNGRRHDESIHRQHHRYDHTEAFDRVHE